MLMITASTSLKFFVISRGQIDCQALMKRVISTVT